MGLNSKKTFVRKPYDKHLYKWSPLESDKKAKKQTGGQSPYCDAKPRTNGEDWITSYGYEKVFIDGIEHRYAYVACNYVI